MMKLKVCQKYVTEEFKHPLKKLPLLIDPTNTNFINSWRLVAVNFTPCLAQSGLWGCKILKALFLNVHLSWAPLEKSISEIVFANLKSLVNVKA